MENKRFKYYIFFNIALINIENYQQRKIIQLSLIVVPLLEIEFRRFRSGFRLYS